MNRATSILLRFLFRYRYFRQILWGVSLFAMCGIAWLFVIRSGALESVPVGWERTFNVSPAGFSVRDYSMCTSGAFAALVIEGETAGTQGIYVSVSVNSAEDFSPVVKVADIPPIKAEMRSKRNPHIAVSADGVLCVVWQELVEEKAIYSIYSSVSRDFGASWSVPAALALGTGMEFLPRIYFDDRRYLHLFYCAPQGTGFNLFHTSSADLSLFEKPDAVARLSSDLKGAFFPSVVFSGENCYAVWQGRGVEQNKLTDDIYFTSSSNYGSSWSRAQRITSSTAFDAAPFLVKLNGRLVCVYENNEKKNWEIRFLMSLDGGKTWDEQPLTVSSTNANCYNPTAAFSSNDTLVFFWYDNREGANRIFSRRYGLSDNRFSREFSISEGLDESVNPYCFSAGRRVAALWEQGGRIRGKFSDVSVSSPLVSSRTHPEGSWSKNAEAIIEWSFPFDESGIAGYASLLNGEPDTNPTIQNLGANTRSERIRSLADGITWYHLRAVDGAGNFSRTAHFPIKVSRTPLPIPAVESLTHPEGKSVLNDSPVLNWQITDIERVKGFVYSLTKDYPGRPSVFTENMSVAFNALDDGRYFFRIQAVDKIGTPGRAADYEFIIGKAENIDPDKYKTIAEGGGDAEPLKKIPVPVFFNPYCEILFPGKAGIWNEKDISLTVKTYAGRAFAFEQFDYELKKDGRSVMRGGSGSSVILLKDLPDGRYDFSVKGKYSYMRAGVKAIGYTKAVSVNFSVVIPPAEDPFAAFIRIAGEKISQHVLALLIMLMCVSCALMLKFNARLVFFIRSVVYRFVSRFRLIIFWSR